MPHDWILRVLADLRDYAQVNNLHTLAGKMDETLLVALAELAEERAGKAAGEARSEKSAAG